MIKVVIDAAPVNQLFDRIETFARTKAIVIMAGVIQHGILRRSAQGIDAEKSAFVKYSAQQARRRDRMGLQVDPPNLRVTGSMFGSMRLEGDELTYPESQQKKASGNMKYRDFHKAAAADIPVGERLVAEQMERLA